MLETSGQLTDKSFLGDMKPAEIIYELGEFWTYAFVGSDKQWYIAHQCDQEGKETRYVVAPSSRRLINRLKAGELGMRAALDMPHVWLVDVRHGDGPVRAYSVQFENILEDYLPTPSALVRVPDLTEKVALSLRAIGPELGEGETPASVVKATTSVAISALKRIVDHLSTQPEWSGVAANDWKRFYDLPVDGFQAASFEVRFGWPKEAADERNRPSDGEIIGAISDLLQVGLSWCAGQETKADTLGSLTPDARRAVLEAVELLSPPQTGIHIDEMRVSGGIVDPIAIEKQAFVLTKATRRQVRGRLDNEKRVLPEAIVAIGVVDAMDSGAQRFTLRHVQHAFSPHRDHPFAESLFPEYEFYFQEDEAEKVLDAFVSKEMMIVRGERRRPQQPFHLNWIAFFADDPEPNDAQPRGD